MISRIRNFLRLTLKRINYKIDLCLKRVTKKETIFKNQTYLFQQNLLLENNIFIKRLSSLLMTEALKTLVESLLWDLNQLLSALHLARSGIGRNSCLKEFTYSSSNVMSIYDSKLKISMNVIINNKKMNLDYESLLTEL